MRQRKERPIPSWGSVIGDGLFGLLMLFVACFNLFPQRQYDPSWFFLVYLAWFFIGVRSLISSLRNGVRKWKSRHKATE